EGGGCGGQSKFIAGTIAQFHVAGARGKWQIRKRYVSDQLSRFEHGLNMWSIRRKLMEIGNGHLPGTARSFDVHRRIERDQSDRHIRWMRGNAVLACAENRMNAVEAFQ